MIRNVTGAMQRIVSRELMRPPELLVVDLSGITRIDTDGVNALASAAVIAGESDIAFCLVDTKGGPVQSALEEAKLTELFEVFPSVGEARRSAQ
jgi:anti-anti-sigma regulatory factor